MMRMSILGLTVSIAELLGYHTRIINRMNRQNDEKVIMLKNPMMVSSLKTPNEEMTLRSDT